MSVASLFKSKSDARSVHELAVALQADEFCKWNVMQAAQHAGFVLHWYNRFDCGVFPGYKPSFPCGTDRTIKNARFYVFQLKREHSVYDTSTRDMLLHRTGINGMFNDLLLN